MQAAVTGRSYPVYQPPAAHRAPQHSPNLSIRESQGSASTQVFHHPHSSAERVGFTAGRSSDPYAWLPESSDRGVGLGARADDPLSISHASTLSPLALGTRFVLPIASSHQQMQLQGRERSTRVHAAPRGHVAGFGSKTRPVSRGFGGSFTGTLSVGTGSDFALATRPSDLPPMSADLRRRLEHLVAQVPRTEAPEDPEQLAMWLEVRGTQRIRELHTRQDGREDLDGAMTRDGRRRWCEAVRCCRGCVARIDSMLTVRQPRKTAPS